MITAIILAGGNSLRFGGEIPKQFTQIAGRSLLDFSVSTFNATPSIDKIIIVVPIFILIIVSLIDIIGDLLPLFLVIMRG